MARQYQRYNKEEIERLLPDCCSYAEVLRRLGKKPTGGVITNLSLMCRRWGIDVGHMTGQGHNKGKQSSKRLSPVDRLVMGNPTDHRVMAYKLRAALIELGVEHKCSMCGIDKWNGAEIIIEIDHIDGQYWNNEPNNLRFLCPNCHSQTPTYKSKNVK
jgi:hypothetical protein